MTQVLFEDRFKGSFNQNGNKWLIPNVLPANSLAMISGKAGSGKSFLMIDILGSISAYTPSVFGLPDEDTFPTNTIHVCLESPGDMYLRYVGRDMLHNEASSVMGVTDFDLTDRQACSEFAYRVQQIVKPNGGISVIGWSTFNRLAPGVDENSTSDMTMVWNNLDMIRKITGATQIVEHHTALGSDRPRGSSVTDGVLHTIINVAQIREGLRISCKKQRNAKPFDPITARIVEVLTKKGTPLPALERVVKGPDGSADALDGAEGREVCPDVASGPREGLTDNARRVLEFAETNGGVSWRDMEPLQLMSKKTFYRAIEALKGMELIVDMGNGKYVTMEDA